MPTIWCLPTAQATPASARTPPNDLLTRSSRSSGASGKDIIQYRRPGAPDQRAIEESRPRSVVFRYHALLGQFLFRILILGQVREPHSAQHAGCLGELDVVVSDDLDAIAPRVAKIEEAPFERGDTSRLELLAGRFLVIDNQTEMATVISGLFTAPLQRNELIAQVDEGHGIAFAPQLECEEAAVERQRLLDVADLERDMVEADDAGLLRSSHGISYCSDRVYRARRNAPQPARLSKCEV